MNIHSQMNNQTEVVAIYFPSWHTNDHYQAWYGQGFTEWDLIKTTKPLYPGHHQPKIPTWGYFDESDPAWSAKEIDIAVEHGVTTFLFDWYWYSGVKIMEEALENGFLKASNRHKMKFALMWANHNWGSWPAITGIPGMNSAVNQSASLWLPIRHSLEDLDRVVDYCCEHYFDEPNYWKIKGKPYFAIFDIAEFSKQLGRDKEFRIGLERMNKRAQKNGLPGIFFSANIGCCNDNIYCCGWGRVPDAEVIGFESVFAYNIVRTTEYDSLPDSRPSVKYDEVIKSHQYCWEQIEKGGLPHHPVVTVGCDVSPRWHRGVSLPMDFRKLAYEPIIEGNTPEKFGQLCSLAFKQVRKNKLEPKAIFINAWNEWSEGMYLLPEKKYGNGYLEAIRTAMAEEL